MAVLSKGIHERFRRLLNLPGDWTPPRNVQIAATECLAWVNERVIGGGDRATLPLEFRSELRMRLAKLVGLSLEKLGTITDDQSDGLKVLVSSLGGDFRELARLHPRPAKGNEPLKWLPGGFSFAEQGRMVQVLRALRLMSKPCVTSRTRQKVTLPGGGTGVTADRQGGERASIHVENLIVGDQITAQASTVVKKAEIEDSFNTTCDDHSTTNEGETKSTVVWFRDNFLMPLIVVLLCALIGWWIGLSH